MTDTAGRPARHRLRRWLRRPLRLLWRGLLALTILLVLAWTFRQQLLVPLVRPQVEAAIANLLGASRVSIGALEGNWLDHVDARQVVVEGAPPPLRAMRGVRVEASYSLLALLGGDLTGLRAAKVSAAEVLLDLRPVPPDPDAAAAAAPATSPADEAWQHWLRDGATVHVDRLRVLASHGERQGPLAVELQPGADIRECTGAYAGVRVAVRTGPPGVVLAPGRLQVSCDAEDPGALLDLFGLGAGVRGGTLHAELDVGLAPLSVHARLDLDDLVHGDERLQQSRVVLRLDHERLTVEHASLDLPGVAVELHEMTLPSPLSTGAVGLRDLAGRFVVRIDDLAPHASLLPAALRESLPIEGRLTGFARDGILNLDAGTVRARGAELVIASGSLPLVGDWRAAEGAVQFALTFAGFTRVLPWLGATTASGRLAGSLTGSLARPHCEVRLDLGECRSERGAIASAQGLVHADAAAAAIEGLQVQGLQVAAAASQAATSVVLNARCGLRAGALDPDSLVVDVEVASMVPEALLAPVFAEHGLGPGPTGLATLLLRARHDDAGIAIATLRLRSAAGSPIEFALDGEGILPLHWSGTAAPTPLAQGALTLRGAARQATEAAGTPQLALGGTLRVDARSAALSRFGLTFGAARLQGEAAMALGVASLLAPAVPFAEAPLRVAVDVEEVDLAALPAAWAGTTRLAGRVNGRVRAAGSLADIAPEVLLTLADGEVRGEGMPALTGAQLRLEVAPSDGVTKALAITTSVSASLDPQLGLPAAVAFAGTIRSDERGTTLEPSVLRIGGGELRLALASSLRRSDLLGGTVDAGRTTLAGTVELREFALAELPARLLGSGDVRGFVSGEIVVDGTLDAAFGPSLLRTARLSLRDGELKLANMPRLERVTADLRGDQHALTLRSLTGVLGAGHFSAQGALRRPQGPLFGSLADAALELRLDGEDVLLFRGDGAKVRASIHATATGTVDAIAVRGDVRLGRGSKYVRHISVLPALGSHAGAPANEGLQLAPLPPALGDRIDLDLAVTTREAVEVRTHVVDGDIDVAAHLRGKGSAPRLEGTMSMQKGVLRFPGANLAVDSGLLTFTRSQPLFPELRVNATGKRMGIVVSMAITGRYDRPQVQLTSVPALPPQDLIVLLTTGQLPSTLAERGATGQARFVGGYLAKEVFEKYFGSESTERGASLFDRLTIETGREVSQNGTESVLVEYELLPRFSVQVERDAYEDYNLGLVLRFRFR